MYDEDIDRKSLSLDIHGRYEGGGRCLNCQHNTEGINCNKCKAKYYRPYEKHWNETDVCQREYIHMWYNNVLSSSDATSSPVLLQLIKYCIVVCDIELL